MPFYGASERQKQKGVVEGRFHNHIYIIFPFCFYTVVMIWSSCYFETGSLEIQKNKIRPRSVSITGNLVFLLCRFSFDGITCILCIVYVHKLHQGFTN